MPYVFGVLKTTSIPKAISCRLYLQPVCSTDQREFPSIFAHSLSNSSTIRQQVSVLLGSKRFFKNSTFSRYFCHVNSVHCSPTVPCESWPTILQKFIRRASRPVKILASLILEERECIRPW